MPRISLSNNKSINLTTLHLILCISYLSRTRQKDGNLDKIKQLLTDELKKLKVRKVTRVISTAVRFGMLEVYRINVRLE